MIENLPKIEEFDEDKADFVIYNTCTVRENANTRVYGRIGYLGTMKKKNPDMKISALLSSNNAKVLEFARFEKGEGIEKKEENFAEEVQKQLGN